MSNVTLKIAGRNYAVACAPGEEAHVASLGEMIDEKVAGMGTAGGQNEVRSLLFAALLLADELHEARKSKNQTPPSAPSDEGSLSEIAPTLERIAVRLENLAMQIENS